MMIKVRDGLYAFLWESSRENNSNAFLIHEDKTILFDPGYSHLFGHVERGLEALNLAIEDIDVVIATHGHPDHIDAAAVFGKPTLFMMGKEEYEYFTKLGSPAFRIPEPDVLLQEGELNIGNIQFQVLQTPGHSPGSLCLYWPERKALFSGDVAFDHSIGRSDLPGGDSRLLKESLQRIGQLDVEYLLPGHGNIVTGRKAVQANFQMIESYWFGYL